MKSKNYLILIFSVLLLLIICTIVVLTLKEDDNDQFKGLLTEVNPPQIDPMSLNNNSEIGLSGWCAFDTEMEGIKMKKAYQINLVLQFDKWDANKSQIPFEISIINQTDKESYPVYGRGILKEGNIIAYYTGDKIDNEKDNDIPSEGRVILEAKNIKNLAQFTGNIWLYPDSEAQNYNFVFLPSFYLAFARSPRIIFEGNQGRKVSIQLIKPFGEDIKGVKALAHCIASSDPEYEENGKLLYFGEWLALIDTKDYMILDCNPMPYIGVAKWKNERLYITRKGERYILNLVKCDNDFKDTAENMEENIKNKYNSK